MCSQAFAILSTMAVLISTAYSAPEPTPNYVLISPCPSFFSYESAEKPGLWTGKLLVQSEQDLNGVWIRLVFDHDVKQVIAEDFETKITEENPRDILVKNRGKLLKAFSPMTVKITVLYEGSQLPNLIEYRLNGRTVCPDRNTLRTDFFEGDVLSKTFLPKLQSNSISSIPAQKYECGLESNQTKQQHLWQATISFNHANSIKVACEAVLISPSYLITPAHCVTFKNEQTPVPTDSLLVNVGQDFRVKVSNVIVHPGYLPGYLDDDLALLKTSVPLDVTDSVRPICLFERKEDDEASSQKAFLVGKYIEKEGAIGYRALEAAALRISQEECELLNPQLKGVLAKNTYCVSFASGNTNCVGSSGNGFISTKGERSTLRGIVTLGVLLQGETECKENSVNVVTDVSKYLKWIQRVIY